MTAYQVKDWNDHFEGAKSRTYKNKSTCQMPTKHGLGYKKIIRHKNGPAMFGAWCAMIQVLSRQENPREGYCTDTGRADGNPYTGDDLEMMTDIPAKVFEDLLQVASRQDVGWLEKCKDTAGAADGYHKGSSVPLNSDLDLDSNSDLDTNTNAKRGALCVFGEFDKVKLTDAEYTKLCEKHGKEKADAGIGELDAWLERTGKRRKNHYACLSDAGWMWEKVGGATADNRKSWTGGLGTGGL